MKPYTHEQLMNMPYVGTHAERADALAGGPEKRRFLREWMAAHNAEYSTTLKLMTAASGALREFLEGCK